MIPAEILETHYTRGEVMSLTGLKSTALWRRDQDGVFGVPVYWGVMRLYPKKKVDRFLRTVSTR